MLIYLLHYSKNAYLIHVLLSDGTFTKIIGTENFCSKENVNMEYSKEFKEKLFMFVFEW